VARQDNGAGQRRAAKVKARNKKRENTGPADEMDIGEFVELVATEIADAVEQTLLDPSGEPAAEFSAMVAELDEVAMAEEGVDSPPGYTVSFLVLDGVLDRARERTGKRSAVPAPVREWIAADIGEDAAAEVARLLALLEDSNEDEEVDLLAGDDLLAAMVLAAVGFVVNYGDGDIDWLGLDDLIEPVAELVQPDAE
jgi:hypothetical protein